MPKSLSEIMRVVQADLEIRQALGQTEGPDTLDDGPVDPQAVKYRRSYTGELRNEDDLVIGVGDASEFDLNTQAWPLTDLYYFLGGLISNHENSSLDADRLRGTLTISVSFSPDELVDDEPEPSFDD